MATVGKCLCGSIEVTCENKPTEIIACYCSSCQMATGGIATFNIVMPDSEGRITKGKTKVFKETADSGNNLERHFCGECGSPIYSATPAFAGHLILKAGLFSGLEGLQVITNIYTDSAPSWAPRDKTLPEHGKMPS